MTESDAKRLELIAAGARKIINQHGHAFHQAVLASCEAMLREEPRAQWNVVASELPATLNNHELHIDIVLQLVRGGAAFIAAECKRVDPARGHWCFARTRGHGFGTKHPLVSQLSANGDRVYESPASLATETEPYHVGFDLRTKEEGNGTGKGVALDEAIERVFRSAGGLMMRLTDLPGWRMSSMTLTILQVVFTTARLFVIDSDISAASLDRGDIASVSLREVPWLWYQTNLSRSQRPRLPTAELVSNLIGLGRIIPIRYTRATAIVNAASGIRGFLIGAADYAPSRPIFEPGE
jgi:hypothetical protein